MHHATAPRQPAHTQNPTTRLPRPYSPRAILQGMHIRRKASMRRSVLPVCVRLAIQAKWDRQGHRPRDRTPPSKRSTLLPRRRRRREGRIWGSRAATTAEGARAVRDRLCVVGSFRGGVEEHPELDILASHADGEAGFEVVFDLALRPLPPSRAKAQRAKERERNAVSGALVEGSAVTEEMRRAPAVGSGVRTANKVRTSLICR